MNIKQFIRVLANFLVPTPATVRRHRAPSARFTTLEALAASRGDSLKRHGRNYNLVTSDLRVLEFDNLAQVKSFFALVASREANKYPLPEPPAPLGNPKFVESACDLSNGGPYPGDADYVERPRNMYKITGPSPEVPQGDNYDIGQPPDVKIRHVYNIGADGNLRPGQSADIGTATPFVRVIATPIVAPTTDINRD